MFWDELSNKEKLRVTMEYMIEQDLIADFAKLVRTCHL